MNYLQTLLKRNSDLPFKKKKKTKEEKILKALYEAYINLNSADQREVLYETEKLANLNRVKNFTQQDDLQQKDDSEIDFIFEEEVPLPEVDIDLDEKDVREVTKLTKEQMKQVSNLESMFKDAENILDQLKQAIQGIVKDNMSGRK
ncbi:MAG: hypothetical protein JXR30_03690 [Alphaproteobacteria bacterium]|nr:hypothetical protein [Alphaproteobacteria bacterium]